MKLYLPSEMEHNLRGAICREDVCEFSKLAPPLKWGKPSWSTSQLLLEILEDEKKKLWLWANKLYDHEDLHPKICPRILARAHTIWSELLKEHFKQVFPILKKWSKHSSPNLRRCIAIAVRSARILRKREWVKPLVQLLEPLLSDITSYVRKNLGPYTIDDSLLRCYPDLTSKHLRRWSHRRDEGMR
jgi:hypothetical protein